MKYASFNIYLNKEKKTWSRKTYSVLELLGDLGGLYDALKLIFAAIVAPFAYLASKVSLLTKVFVRNVP